MLSDPGLLGAMVGTVTKRLREREAALCARTRNWRRWAFFRRDFLHEVNNPAAAIARAAHHLAIVAGELVPPQKRSPCRLCNEPDRNRR